MKFPEAFGTLGDMLKTVKDVSAMAATLGIPGITAAAQIANSAAKIAEVIMERVAEGKIVASTDDVDKIRALAMELRAENDKLAAQIAAS